MLWLISLILLPLAALGYIGWHLWVLLPCTAVWKTLVLTAGLACFLSLFLDFTGRLDALPMPLARCLYAVGTSSLIVILYMVLTFVVLDLGRLLHLVPGSWLVSNWLATGVLGLLMFGLLLYGNLHYRHKVRVPLELTTSKPLPHAYRLVMASDLHLGYHNPRRELARWVDMINAEQPDLVLIAGDIIDVSVRPLIEEDMAAEFRRLQAPVYACLGNHEYYSGNARAQQFYRDAGIHLLTDSATVVDSALMIIGRDDRTNPRRKRLENILSQSPSLQAKDSVYTIVLDHQPYHLEEAERQGVDFQLSGHTHRGQVWPISWLTDRMYECSWGSHRRGSTAYYVSSGLGIWGGKFRIGTQSEYVVMRLEVAD